MINLFDQRFSSYPLCSSHLESAPTRLSFPSRKSISKSLEEIRASIAHHIVNLTVSHAIRYLFFLLVLIKPILFGSCIKIIEKKVQVFFVLLLHVVHLSWLYIICSCNLKFNLMCSLLSSIFIIVKLIYLLLSFSWSNLGFFSLRPKTIVSLVAIVVYLTE